MKNEYNPETYWSNVGKIIEAREDGKNIIAGDDEPYYRYKRIKFLNLLKGVDFSGKSVLEIGCGPGGNLLEVSKLHPLRLVGVDISDQMVSLAKNKTSGVAEVIKINGVSLPFKDNEFDIVFTATVLQHNTDEKMLLSIMSELCRVCKGNVFLFERIESSIKGDELCLGRPISYYSKIMTENSFKYESSKFINIRVSYYICGAIRKLFNPKTRIEGEPLTKFSVFLQNLFIIFTPLLDKIFTSKKDLAKLEYRKV